MYRLDENLQDRCRFAETIYRWGAESAKTTDAELTDETLAAYRESQLEHDDFDDIRFAARLFNENFRRGWQDERGL